MTRPRIHAAARGDLFGLLTAIKELPMHSGRQTWLFQCSCGEFLSRQMEVVRFGVRNGSQPNCGCLTKQIRSRSGKLKTEHGLSVENRRLYDVHRQMLQRCENPSSKDFKHYGDRGITVCGEWRDPVVFFAWAYESGYRRGLTIERVDVNGNYEPGNCTWVPNERQSHNTRRNVFLTIDGVTHHLAEWARLNDLKWPTVSSRIRSGWDLKLAVSTPSQGAQR
jgi:hypothetical protein